MLGQLAAGSNDAFKFHLVFVTATKQAILEVSPLFTNYLSRFLQKKSLTTDAQWSE